MCMLAAWILYALLVTGLVALAARLFEATHAAGSGRMRWGWLAGLLSAPLVIFLPSVALPGSAGSEATLGGIEVLGGPEVGAIAASPERWSELAAWFEGALSALASLSPWILGIWLLLSFFLTARVLVGAATLRRAAARWAPSRVEGAEVLVSDGLGPGLMGLFRARTVLPPWCLELDAEARALVVAHEDEHRRSRDALLLALSKCLVVLAPWNLPLVWMDRRLRVAVELDCDARVARRYPDRLGRYARLLVDVAARPRVAAPATRLASPLALFAEPDTPLHRRIDMLTRTPTSSPRGRTVVLGGLAVLLLAAAALVPGCETGILAPDPALDDAAETEVEEAPSAISEAGPTFTPYTVAPEVRNRDAVMRTLQEEYPPLLRNAGVGGTALLYLYIDSEGVVQDLRIHESSGHAALDQAALRVGESFAFSPALNRETAVPVWIQLPITFRTEEGAAADEAAPGERERRELVEEARDQAEAEASAPSAGEGPTFTPYTVAPEVRNRAVVSTALVQEYPPLLRDAGVGGTALVYFHIDAEGAVNDVRIERSSGHAALDQAALRVAETFEFSPAMNQDQRVPVWIQIPITFQTR
jgi:TonB family protein